MLQITKILEGGVDLTTGQELERCIVVSNGKSEATIAVTSEELMALMVLYARAMEDTAEKVVTGMPAPPKMAEPYPPEFFREAPSPPDPVVYDDPPPSTDLREEDEDEFEPDETYDDLGTGIGSL